METKNIAWMGKIIKVVTFLMVIAVIALAGASIAFASETISGIVTDPAPIIGATIELHSFAGGVYGALVASNTTIAGGAYSITVELPASGLYAINASKAGTHNSSIVSPIVIFDNQNKSVNITLVPTAGFSMATLSGTVRDSVSAAAIIGATIVANGTGGTFITTTGVSGTYSISAPPGGIYTVTASAPLYNNGVDVTVITVGGNNYPSIFNLVSVAPAGNVGPGPVTGLTGTGTGVAQITWSWVNPTDADFAYSNISLDGVAVTATAATTYVANGLSCGPHTLVVKTYDSLNAHNASNDRTSSATATACTPPPIVTRNTGGSSSNNVVMPSPAGKVIILDFAEANTYTKTMWKYDSARFAYNQETHTISIISISKTKVDLRIRMTVDGKSSVSYVSLEELQSKDLSFDGDTEPDFTIKLNKIDFAKQEITLTISKIKKEVAEQPVEPQPVVEEKAPESTVEVVAQTLTGEKPSLQKGVIVAAAVAVICFLLYLLFFVWI